MDKKNNAADRVRPILKAMERSVDAARRQRLYGDAAPVEPLRSPEVTGETGAREGAPRLKARPKRPDSRFGDFRARAS